MFAYKGSFGFDWVVHIDSLTVILFSCSKKLKRRTWAHLRCKTNNNILLFYPFVQDANDSFVPCFAFVLCIMSSVAPLYNDHKPELDINNVCALNKLDLAAYIFRSAKSQRRHWCIRLEFDTSSVWQRAWLWIWLKLIEFNGTKVWRSFDSLAVTNFMKNLTTTTSVACLQNPAAFLLKLCGGKSNMGQESSS